MRPMDRIAEQAKESQSGPDLFFNLDDEVISLGTLHHLLCEIQYAVQAAQLVIAQLDKGYEEDAVPVLTGQLALDYADACIMAIRPQKDIDGLEFWIEDGKITYITPQERYAATMKAKAKKARP